MNNELIVYLQTPDNIEFVARIDPRAEVVEGQELFMLLDMERLYFFDREMETVLT